MKKILNSTVFILSAAILAFSGCEAGISNGSSTSSSEDSGFSFSEMYSSIANLQQDNTAIRAELSAITGDTSILDEITLLKAEIAALKTAKAPVESVVPVGAVIAWHKSFSGVPAMPSNFVECDGSVISDADSTLNGQTLPDLNGEGRFLRGASSSGTLQDDQVQDHTHNIPVWQRDDQKVFTSLGGMTSWGWQADGSNNTTRPSNGASGAQTGSETRPTNMSVVWVMRIK
ncbi:MAG: hypothetical protein GY754_43945 [bacterium]|nr:hypothetical protein [bacterium]